jgi:hypothetical protein
MAVNQNPIVYRDRIADDVIPIGSDSLGNQVCLGLKGKHKDKIDFWDYELEGSQT